MKKFFKLVLVPAVVGMAFATSAFAQSMEMKPDAMQQDGMHQGAMAQDNMQSAPAAQMENNMGSGSHDMQPATMTPAEPMQNDGMMQQGGTQGQGMEAPAKSEAMM